MSTALPQPFRFVTLIFHEHVLGELHGNLSQTERMENLALFESGKINVLICTDLAARGLDFLVNTVINYEIPSNLATYVHRIGRTGRAGRKGTSCSLVRYIL